MKRWGLAFAVLIAGFLGGVSYQLLPQTVRAPIVLPTPKSCHLEQDSCQARDSQGHHIQLSLAPRPVPVMETVQVQVQANGFSTIKSAKLTITGLNMFMGYQYVDLQLEQGTWQGSFTLPICTQRHMQWQAQLDIQTDTHHFRALFPFDTHSSQVARPLAKWLQDNAPP